MSVRIEKSGSVWTVIHSRPEARNAMDPKSADDLVAAFETVRCRQIRQRRGVLGRGRRLLRRLGPEIGVRPRPEQSRRQLDFPKGGGKAPRGPLGPSRLELSKPVIAAVEGPAVAGGMELAMWSDVRVMAESAYFGVYCRRWGVPLIDGGTVRLPRLVGMGKAMEIIMTGRKVHGRGEPTASGCARRLCRTARRARPPRRWRRRSRAFPQECMRSDRLSAYRAWGKSVREGLESEWATSAAMVKAEGIRGATRFAEGKGRHGDFKDI